MRQVTLTLTLLALAAGCGAGASDGSSTAAVTPATMSGIAPLRMEGSRYLVTPLISDGSAPTPVVDPRLVNGWGLVSSATSPWWVANNGTGTSSLYDGTGHIVARLPFINVAGAGGAAAAPTGIVFNAGTGFVVTGPSGSGAARFIFASEDGTISAWNPAAAATTSVVEVDNSGSGAVYKGLAIATTAMGDRLFATDFHNGRVDVFDSTFAPVTGHLFVDPHLRRGYAPFGIRAIGGVVYVTYAKQDANRHDDVAGPGHGFVSAFTVDGAFLRRVASHGHLDSPWGLAVAPATGFGSASGKLLVGNFGSGRIVAFALETHDDAGDDDGRDGSLLRTASGALVIDGLWGLGFGNGTGSGPVTTLYFAAGPAGESEGLFGSITVE